MLLKSEKSILVSSDPSQGAEPFSKTSSELKLKKSEKNISISLYDVSEV